MRGSFGNKVSALAIAVAVASAVLFGAGTAVAEEPRDDAFSYVTDPYGVVGSSERDLEYALADLNRSEGLDVRFVFVNDFSGADGQSWAESTRLLTGSTDQEILFAIETGGLEDGYSTAPNVKLTDQQIDAVYYDYVLPALKRGDWAGSVDAAVRGFESTFAAIHAADGSKSPSPAPSSKPVKPVPGFTASGKSESSVIGIIMLILIGVGVLSWVVIRRRLARKRLEAEAAGRESELGALVLALDDRIKAAREEIGFAEATFTDELVAPAKRQIDAVASEAVTLMTNYNAVLDIVDLRTRVGQLGQCLAAAHELDARLSEPMEYLRQLQAAAQNPGEALDRLGDDLAGLLQVAVEMQGTQQKLAGRCVGPDADALSRVCVDLAAACDRAQAAAANAQYSQGGSSDSAKGRSEPHRVDFLERYAAALQDSAGLSRALSIAEGVSRQLEELDRSVDIEIEALDAQISAAIDEAQGNPSCAESPRLLQYCQSAITSRNALACSLPRDPRIVVGRLAQVRIEVQRGRSTLSAAVQAQRAAQMQAQAQRAAQQSSYNSRAGTSDSEPSRHSSSWRSSSGTSGYSGSSSSSSSWTSSSSSSSSSSSRGGGGGRSSGGESDSSRGGGGGRSSDSSGRGGGGGRR